MQFHAAPCTRMMSVHADMCGRSCHTIPQHHVIRPSALCARSPLGRACTTGIMPALAIARQAYLHALSPQPPPSQTEAAPQASDVFDAAVPAGISDAATTATTLATATATAEVPQAGPGSAGGLSSLTGCQDAAEEAAGNTGESGAMGAGSVGGREEAAQLTTGAIGPAEGAGVPIVVQAEQLGGHAPEVQVAGVGAGAEGTVVGVESVEGTGAAAAGGVAPFANDSESIPTKEVQEAHVVLLPVVSQRLVLYPEPGVGHEATAGMHRAVRAFFDLHLRGVPRPFQSVAVQRHVVALSADA